VTITGSIFQNQGKRGDYQASTGTTLNHPLFMYYLGPESTSKRQLNGFPTTCTQLRGMPETILGGFNIGIAPGIFYGLKDAKLVIGEVE